MDFPSGKYRCIYADPGWSYDNKRTGGSMDSGSSSKYRTMSLDDIAALPVPSILASSTVLFLWVTTPLKDYGLHVMQQWGFKYKTTIYWHKISARLGMGFWTRGEVEELLFGIHGKVTPFRSTIRNHLDLPILGHSEKPEEFRQIIETLTPDLTPRIELFARKRVLGWDAWGDELPAHPWEGK